MAKYQVTLDLDVDTQNLDDAYRAAERLIQLGARAAGIETPVLTVAVLADRMPRTGTDFTITVPCSSTRPRAAVQISFRPGERRGAVVVWDDADPDFTVDTFPLTPQSLQWLVRGLWSWPMDLLDDMAREDEIKRRKLQRDAGGE